jgi:ABC-type antimicrobial peptide transport system permease subunit
MISPDQVDRLEDQLDRFTTALIIGCMFFLVGGTLGIFAGQEIATGTDFMQRLAGAEQAVGVLLIAVGWIKVYFIRTELERNAPPQTAAKAATAQAGR